MQLPKGVAEDVLQRVPAALQACSTVFMEKHNLSQREVPSSGLKFMRGLSKSIRSSVSTLITGYTLRLTGRASLMVKQTQLLKSTNLSVLRIEITGGSIWHIFSHFRDQTQLPSCSALSFVHTCVTEHSYSSLFATCFLFVPFLYILFACRHDFATSALNG